MSEHSEFSRYLIRSADESRRPFSIAYTALWLHLALGIGLFLLLQQGLSADVLTDLAIASLAIALVLYGLLARRYLHLSNLLTYAVALSRALAPADWRPVVELGPLFLTLVSTYLVLAGEYRDFLAEKDQPKPLPFWWPLLAASLLALFAAFALYLIWPRIASL